jgi:hypothetical protein
MPAGYPRPSTLRPCAAVNAHSTARTFVLRPALSPRQAIGARLDGNARCARAVTYGIDQGADAATPLRPIASGRRQSNAERGIGSDSTLNVERRIRRNETLDVEAELGRECRVINRRAERWRGGLKGPDDVSEVARAPPGRTGKGP